jgi:metal-responsive CopG/Arc/MetJ family transcriptional regulator
MSIQIAVRLPDALVHAVDEVVAHGQASSRAELVARALRRELRRQRAIADLERLGAEDDDLGGFTAYAARTPLPD